MIDTHKVFRQEGDPAFPVEEKDPSSDSPSKETEAAGDPPAKEPEKPKPFHEDPAVQEYIERQVSNRVDKISKDLEEKFGGSVAQIREEFGQKRKENAEASKIPPWFGGNQAQWDQYREWFDGQLKQAEDRAVNGTIERAREATSAEKKAVDEATEYFKTELAAITADKKLNPTGKAIDPNALLKAVLDNELVDTKGRWNYRAGMRFLNSHTAASHAHNKEKKDIAGATMDGSGAGGGEPKPKSFKTPADFRKKRPW